MSMYIKVIPICWQWQQSCSSERDALFSLVLQGNEYWAYEVSATVRWLTLSQTQAGHIWGYVLCMSHRIPIRIYIYIYINLKDVLLAFTTKKPCIYNALHQKTIHPDPDSSAGSRLSRVRQFIHQGGVFVHRHTELCLVFSWWERVGWQTSVRPPKLPGKHRESLPLC